MSGVKFRLLGSPAIRLGRGEIALRPERRFQLLAYLGTRSGWISRDELACLFWPERDNPTARRNLRWLLHSMRELGTIEELEIERDRVRLHVPTDLAEFERAVAEKHWSDAIELYRGEFLAGVEGTDTGPYSQWLHGVRPRVADDFRSAVLKWIDANPTAYAEHLALTRRLHDRDPFDEHATVIALRALLATGQTDVAQSRYRDFAQRLLTEMGLEPGRELRALARSFTADFAADRRPQVAPAASGPSEGAFVGRERELATLIDLLDAPSRRLITISGPGGIGKSRLATELAAHRGALAVVALEALTLPAQIPGAVAAALGLRLDAAVDAEGAVAASLTQRAGLLVLDNFEHLVDGAKVIEQWLQQCPRLKIVVTSRELLELADEQAFPLEGLTGPEAGMAIADAAACDAIRLFVDRALRNKPGFEFARERAGAERIVTLVDGMPLALELAASWTRLLSCDAIAADLQGGIDVLVAANEDGRTEHRSMRACLEHSWALLLPREGALLARLAVFRGDFSLQAARVIADAQLPALASLVDKSLLRSRGEGRFSLHPLVLRFAEEKLRAIGGALAETQSRHARLYMDLLARCAQEVKSGRQTLVGIDLEFDNCFAAWWWALEAARFDLLAPAADAWAMYFETRGRMSEGLDLYQRTAETPAFTRAPAQLRAGIERGRAVFLMRRGDHAESARQAYDALRHYRALRDSEGIRACMNLLGNLAWQQGAYARARRYFEEGAKRAAPGSREAWRFVCNLALATQSSGDYGAARALFEKGVAIARRRADLSDLAFTLNNLGNLCIALHELDDARRHLLEALQLSQQTGGHLGEPYMLVNLAVIDIELGQTQRARECLEQAFAAVRRSPDSQVEPMCLYTLARIESVAGHFARARKLLAEAARIAVRSDNLPNMTEVAIWAADNWGREGNPDRAAAILAPLLDHPSASRGERATARRLFDDLALRLDESALAAARARAGDQDLRGLMSRVIAASQPEHETSAPDLAS